MVAKRKWVKHKIMAESTYPCSMAWSGRRAAPVRSSRLQFRPTARFVTGTTMSDRTCGRTTVDNPTWNGFLPQGRVIWSRPSVRASSGIMYGPGPSPDFAGGIVERKSQNMPSTVLLTPLLPTDTTACCFPVNLPRRATPASPAIATGQNSFRSRPVSSRSAARHHICGRYPHPLDGGTPSTRGGSATLQGGLLRGGRPPRRRGRAPPSEATAGQPRAGTARLPVMGSFGCRRAVRAAAGTARR